MMEKDCILLFDLDGTLTDSSEGITRCVQLALRHMGIDVPDRKDLLFFIGPPLRESFPKMGVPAERVEEAVAVFRKRYNTVGKFENMPYPEIPGLLDKLKRDGFRMYVTTSKPESTAKDILEKFGLAPFFEQICGADMAGARDKKEAVIRYLLDMFPRLPADRVRMIGDREYDVLGAAACGIQTVGVRWGFGSVQELQDAGAVEIAEDCADLRRILLKWRGELDRELPEIPGD